MAKKVFDNPAKPDQVITVNLTYQSFVIHSTDGSEHAYSSKLVIKCKAG